MPIRASLLHSNWDLAEKKAAPEDATFFIVTNVH
jgi:hypothetical protein